MADTLEDTTQPPEESDCEIIIKNIRIIKYSKNYFFKQESAVTIQRLTIILDELKELYTLSECVIDNLVSHFNAKSPEYTNSIINLSEDGSITFLNIHATFDTFEGDTFNINLKGCRIKFRMAPARRLKAEVTEVSYLWGLYSYSRVREVSYSTAKTVKLKDLDIFLEYFKEQLYMDTKSV